MASYMMDDSVADNYSDSDAFSPEPVSKKAAMKKAPAAKAAPKKMVHSTLKKTVPKKRAKEESEDEDSTNRDDSNDDASFMSNTPPSAKKQKKAPASKKSGGKPLQALENESMNIDASPNIVTKKSTKTSATDRYQRLTQLEHIIKRPDTYIGSVERTEQQMWVFNCQTEEMEIRKVSFVPGLYKIFDEILVNAADNKQNDSSMKMIKVVIDRDEGLISVENDGRGIPIEIHEKEKIYIPEMIFGHLLTGSNYDDEEAKTTGGRNGYGAKLCNIFSNEFTLETQDTKNGKRYKQTWTENMSKMGKARITSSKSSDFTRVSFKPDFEKFKMDGMDDDLEALFKRRVYDMAGTIKGVSVSLNGTKIKVNNFKKYIEMYAKAIARERGAEDPSSSANSVIVDDPETHNKWEIGFAVSDGSFQQVSFVNSIATTSGGTHVNYIADQICTKLLEVVKKRNSKGAALKANQVRNHIFLFVNCLIVNPAFTSQTKEQLTTKASQFGSKCVVTEDFLKKIAKTDAVTNILHFAQQKADQVLSKSDGNRRSRMSNPKLVDANLAGTKHGHECTLILTEGDSAKGLAVAGRAVLDPDRIGVFPLRGKLLNVRDASVDQISKNAEIQNIKQFLGLKHKTTYTDTKGLRYGHLMIMADQDHDGSHIKGLLINFLQVQFPSLLKLPDFFREFITPIVKVWKGNNPKKLDHARSFFTMPQYEEWKEKHRGERGWHHKYYKGLGTSSNQDAQVYFTNLDDHLKEFKPMKVEEEELFDLAFSKKKADARKQWLGNFVPGTFLDHSSKRITYDDFVNRELILFSMADNMRSIPSVIDGLKPGQRKVLYACFNRNLVKDMKVVELAGYCSELTAYQHGEQSLNQTIVGLAQDFVGSNNVNVLEPSGNFGSRLAGGSDSASPRYIYTRLSPFARRIFSTLDEPKLNYNTDDDRKIEPKVYAPVVPMILLNGAEGIGTGWSTSIPNYHPQDIVDNLKRRMGRLSEEEEEEKPFEPMMPWFRGWKGTPEEAGLDRFKFNGSIRRVGETNEVEITELPIKMWTDDFKARLEEIIKAEKTPSFIKDYKEFNDHANVHFIIQMDEKHMAAAIKEGLEEKFKLQKQIATSNLVAFDSQGLIKKYEKVEDILEEFYVHRLAKYTERKAHWVEIYGIEYRKLSNQARFVMEIIDGKLVVSKKAKAKLVDELRKRGYEAFPKLDDAKKNGERNDVVENDEEAGDDVGGARDYDYLLGLPIWSLTMERVDKLKQQMVNKKQELDDLKALSEKDLWCTDLDDFITVWNERLVEDGEIKKKIRSMGRRVSQKIGAGKGNKMQSRLQLDDDYAPKLAKGPKVVVKAPLKKGPPESFMKAFTANKPKPKVHNAGSDGAADSDGMSDDDFAALNRANKPSAPAGASRAESRAASEVPSLAPAPGRNKRAAAAKPKNWLVDDDEESDSDGDNMLGNIDDMVKGIGNDRETGNNGRVSLFGMSRSGSSSGRPSSATGLPKNKGKAKVIDLSDDDDQTNYEMLARSSPHKPAPVKDTGMLDSFLSDEDDLPLPKKAAVPPRPKPAPKPKKAPVPKKPVATAVAQSKSMTLSPAAKAYALKQSKLKTAPVPKRTVISDDEDSDVHMSDDDEDSPVKPAARRPARTAAAAPKKKPVYVDSDEEESAMVIDDDESEDFDDDD